jgi:hypothetical protein
MADKTIVGVECKHVFYSPCLDEGDYDNDMVFVKERIHYSDGTTEPNFKMIPNYQRDFYVTREGFRTHKQKKTYEEVSKCIKHTSNQRNLSRKVSRALGYNGFNPGLKALSESPYLYGTDINIESLVKADYTRRARDLISNNRVAVLDVETDVETDNEEIISCAVTFGSKAILTATEDWIKPQIEKLGSKEAVIEQVHNAFEKYLPEDKKNRKIELEFVICENGGHCVEVCINRAHQWSPDFIAIWNIDFDMPKMLHNLEKYGYNPDVVFSDPSVPKNYQFSKYVKGQTFKVSALGVKNNLAPSEQWHTFKSPASFYFIDAMCVYRIIRTAKGLEKSYALDYILEKEIGERKLRFDLDQGKVGYEWHLFMQKNYHFEYLIYNLFDCIGVEKLDEKTKDLQLTVSLQNKINSYDLFPRQPKRMSNNIYFKNIDKGRVTLSHGGSMKTELDEYVVDTEGWIVTLPTHLRTDGLFAVDGMENHATYIYTHTYDLDVGSAYPTGQEIFNCAIETTLRERYRIGKLTEEDMRRVSLDLATPQQNAYEICRTAMQAKSFSEALEGYLKDKAT